MSCAGTSSPGGRLRWLVALVLAASLVVGTSFWSSTHVAADPAGDALARLHELSRRAEQMTEAIYWARLDLDSKIAAQTSAEQDRITKLSALDDAAARLVHHQVAVNRAAVALYMGGRTSVFSALLDADSPQQLLDQLGAQRVAFAQLSKQLTAYRLGKQKAGTAAEQSASAAAQARIAVEQAATRRAELQIQQDQLNAQIAATQAQYDALTPDQRAILADPLSPTPVASPAPLAEPGVVAMPAVPGGSPSGPEPVPPVSSPGGTGTAVVQAALTRIGAPYSWGAAGPEAFDCSGLIMWAFQQIGKSLPHSSQALAAGGQPVATDQMQPGDIVTFYSDASHAGIYVGNGQMVHASTYGTPVKVAPVSNAPIHNVRRW